MAREQSSQRTSPGPVRTFDSGLSGHRWCLGCWTAAVCTPALAAVRSACPSSPRRVRGPPERGRGGDDGPDGTPLRLSPNESRRPAVAAQHAAETSGRPSAHRPRRPRSFGADPRPSGGRGPTQVRVPAPPDPWRGSTAAGAALGSSSRVRTSGGSLINLRSARPASVRLGRLNVGEPPAGNGHFVHPIVAKCP